MKLLVTGGAGFIGSHFIRHMMGRRDVACSLTSIKLTYAGHLDNLREFTADRRYRFVRGDIANAALVHRLIKEVDAIINFAAEPTSIALLSTQLFSALECHWRQVLLEEARRAKMKRSSRYRPMKSMDRSREDTLPKRPLFHRSP